MADTTPQKDENIVIRTMKDDLEKLSGATLEKPKEPEKIPVPPVTSASQESQVSIPGAPTGLKVEPKPAPLAIKPPVLVVPPKTVTEIPTKPLFKATPVWLKIGAIGLGLAILVLASLYSYWKIFIQSQPTPPITPPIATTTIPTLPITPVATTTAPIKFFNKFPNKEVTIEIPSKTSAGLLNALKSEMTEEEARASVKQINITYQGKPINTEDFFNLMSIFTPQNFLLNYENEFAFAFFSQKEGARPILILKAKNRTEMETQMKDWETKTLASDIFPLFLNNGQLPKILSQFKSYLFIGQSVRYLNINLPFASLNYAIYNDFLIFTTSSAGMFVILQDLTGQSVSFDFMNSLEASINKFVK